MKYSHTQQKAFTLVETLVVVSLVILIGVGISLFQRDIFFLSSVTQSNLSTQMEARQVLRTFVKEARSMSPSSVGSYPIESVSTSSIIFFVDVDGNGTKERVRYFLEDGEIKRGVVVPTGSPPMYSLGTEDVRTVMRHVLASTSTPLFSYFDDGFIGQESTPLSPPFDTASIRHIRVRVEVDADINRPGSIVAETSVTLRNLKDNL